jgi:hypothetical protein
MKSLNTFLIVVCIVCSAVVFIGFVVVMATTDSAALSPGSVANTVNGVVVFCVAAACIIAPAVVWTLFVKTSRHPKGEAKQAGSRKPYVVFFSLVTFLACLLFGVFYFMTRWDVDEKWAATVIEESSEIRFLLEEFRRANGEFPMSLSEIDEDYLKPTDYLSRHAVAAGMSKWFYERIGAKDYQLYVTAYSWVSYYDAMVYRHSGAFAEPWFSTLDTSHSREFGKWRYIRGFSQHDEMGYFDADGQFHSR